MKRSKMILTVTLLIITISIQLASAQDPGNPEFKFQPKSKTRACMYSFLATTVPVTLGAMTISGGRLSAAPMILISSGLIIGPSAGYFYGGCTKRGLTGTLVRFGTGAFTVFVVKSTTKKEIEHDDRAFAGPDYDFGAAVGGLAALLGLSVVIIQSIYDISEVEGAVEERNEDLLSAHGMTMSLLPKYFADSNAAGLELNITF